MLSPPEKKKPKLSLPLSTINQLFDSILKDTSNLDYKLYSAYEDKRVCLGPFKGMELNADSRWQDGNLCLKMFGYYEYELHDAIEKAIARKPKSVLNIGCAEGYYAVGFARRLNVPVDAVDISTDAIRATAAMAAKNGVTKWVKTHVLDKGEPLSQADLIVMDNEGAEANVVKVLNGHIKDLIVECHDFMTTAGTTEPIVAMLNTTHDIEYIEPRPPLLSLEYAEHALFQALIMTEKRAKRCRWLACWAK